MVIEYIGRTTDFKGKALWEILGNLKNFGVGRLVTRSVLKKYPEPCYFRILKVAAQPDMNNSYVNPRRVTALVEKVFRGERFPKYVQIESASYKPDYILIPKDEEHLYVNNLKPRPMKTILPQYIPLPPIMQEYIKRTAGKDGYTEDDLRCKLKINKKGNSVKKYQIAENEVKPNVELTMGLGTPIFPSLYNNVENNSKK